MYLPLECVVTTPYIYTYIYLRVYTLECVVTSGCTYICVWTYEHLYASCKDKWLSMDVHTSMYGLTYINIRFAITNEYKWRYIHLFHDHKWMYIDLFMDAHESIRNTNDYKWLYV